MLLFSEFYSKLITKKDGAVLEKLKRTTEKKREKKRSDNTTVRLKSLLVKAAERTWLGLRRSDATLLAHNCTWCRVWIRQSGGSGSLDLSGSAYTECSMQRIHFIRIMLWPLFKIRINLHIWNGSVLGDNSRTSVSLDWILAKVIIIRIRFILWNVSKNEAIT